MTKNPFFLCPPAVLSFSGGRTSGMMLAKTLEAHGGALPARCHVLFANTGRERPETLAFVQQCATRWEVPIIWIEYRYCESTHTYAAVDYHSASRDGRPFAELIAARDFLPNPVMRFCTQELKIRVLEKYMRDCGYHYWDVAIGIRADERHRIRLNTGKTRWERVYPLAEAGVTLRDVNEFWARQPFDLQLRPHEGNCDLCFLKGTGKLTEILRERPDLAAWWVEQESKLHGKTGTPAQALFRKDRPSYAGLLKMASDQGYLYPDDGTECGFCTD